MFAELGAKLKEWARREDVQWIIWRGEVPVGKTRAFCAGGELNEVISVSDGISPFIGPEYVLDHYIAHFPKPQVAIWDGIVMGAGYGLTGHATIRVSTENTQFAMPEARFGLIADIGCAYLLTSRCPAHLGTYLTLTADRVRGGLESVWSGIATHSIHSSRLPSLYSTLIKATTEFFHLKKGNFPISGAGADASASQSVNGIQQLLIAVVNDVSQSASSTVSHNKDANSTPRLQALLPFIQTIFSLKTIKDVYEELKRLDVDPEERIEGWKQWIKFCLNALEVDCCPTSTCANFEMMRKAQKKGFTYADSLINDYRAAVRISLRDDIRNGANAILQKTGPPKWSPSSILEVDQAYILSLFDSLEENPTNAIKTDLVIPAVSQ